MEVRIWGARGSTSVSGAKFVRYSGETACLEVRTAAGDIIFLDAGTGLGACAAAGRIRPEDEKPPVICLSHLHLDHVLGLPFFAPLYQREMEIYGPQFPGESRFAENLGRLFDGVLFPVRLADLKNLRLTGVFPHSCFRIGSAEIEVVPTNHPGGNLAWKITADGRTLVYTGDHEIPLDDSDTGQLAVNDDLLKFIDGCDLAVVDSHFSAADHKKRKGWGHSDFFQWCAALADKKIGRLIFSHFSPAYGDRKIDRLLAESRKLLPHIKVAGAKQGLEIKWPDGKKTGRAAHKSVYDFLLHLSRFSDANTVLDALLAEARRVCRADAGCVYLVDKEELVFMAAQNDTLFPASAANKYAYLNARLPLDSTSIAGHVATTGKSLNIPDAGHLNETGYCFNDFFNQKTGYRTRSILGVPLFNARRNVIGTLQLVNATKNGRTVPFGARDAAIVERLASIAALPLEKATLLASMISSLQRTSALRDPLETSSHVGRVGSIAAELYHRWAECRHVPAEEILANKGRLRLAAMLHDIGKVGIPDEILKKPGSLTEEERRIMRTHSALGAGFFDKAGNEIERMAREVALYHHARWDGGGYTGADDIPCPKGEDIPVWARIVAIADVYDALVSKRCYKDAWKPEDALEILRKGAGSHFDPELVERFMEIRDISMQSTSATRRRSHKGAAGLDQTAWPGWHP